MKLRVLGALLVFVLLLSLVPAVGAQDVDLCFGLSAEDCEIINSASANMETATSFNQAYSIEFSATGLGALDPTMGDITFNSSGSGPFAMVEGGMFPIAMQMTLDAAVTGGPDGDMSGTMQFIIVDDYFYMENPEEPGQWLGLAIEDAMNQAGTAGLPFDPAALASGDMGELDAMAGDMDPAMVEPFTALLSVPGFITYERLPDEEMMGQAMIPFSFTMDVGTLATAPEFMTALETLAEAAGDPSLTMLGAMVPMLINEGTMNVTQWVGADDNLIHKLSFDLNTTIDLAMLVGSAGEDAPELEPIVVDLYFEVTLSDFNTDFGIAAPEEFIDMSEMGMD